MDSRSPAAARRRPVRLALVIAFALIGAACGSTHESTAVAAAGGSTTGELPSTEFTPQLSDSDIPEYGASLDEFLDADLEQPSSSPPPDGFVEIEWADLIPAGYSGAELSAEFDRRMADVEDGSLEADVIFAELQAEYDNQPVNPELAGDEIMLAGFVAPLAYDGELITEFLLVPYFGACIHVPPPPANQTVMVKLKDGEGLTIDDSWGAVWVTGTMTVDGADTDLATAGYTITDAQTGVYDQF